jgi:hypothetical protein
VRGLDRGVDPDGDLDRLDEHDDRFKGYEPIGTEFKCMSIIQLEHWYAGKHFGPTEWRCEMGEHDY